MRPSLAVRPVAIWTLRLLPLTVVAQLAPDLWRAVLHEPGAAEQLAESAPIILGVGALRALALSFAVTPLMTLFGWRWHVVLRRDFGRWAFGFALADLIIAAADSGGDPIGGLAGHAFLALGTLATLLLAPLALTSTSRWQRRLGRFWRSLHLLVYPILGVVAAHIFLLPDGPASTVQMSYLFGPSLLLRIPPVRRAIAGARTRRGRRPGAAAVGVAA